MNYNTTNISGLKFWTHIIHREALLTNFKKHDADTLHLTATINNFTCCPLIHTFLMLFANRENIGKVIFQSKHLCGNMRFRASTNFKREKYRFVRLMYRIVVNTTSSGHKVGSFDCNRATGSDRILFFSLDWMGRATEIRFTYIIRLALALWHAKLRVLLFLLLLTFSSYGTYIFSIYR